MGAIIKLAERLNPAESQQIAPNNEWPPRADKPRIDAYTDNYLIWSGQHEHVMVTQNTEIHGEYISVNVAKTIVTIPADLLFGEDLGLVYPDDAPEAVVAQIDEIWKRNQVQTLLYENALDTGYAGDGVWTVGREVDGEKGLAVIKTHPAETWFPVCHPDDIRNVEKHRLAWVKKRPNARGTFDEYLRVVIHEKGAVYHELWLLKDGKIKGEAEKDAWAYFYPDGRPDAEQEGVEGEFLLVHIPNFRTAREYFGQSEYRDTEPLFAAINDRVSQVDYILNKHSDPILEVPWELWTNLTDSGKRDVDMSMLKVVGKSENGVGATYLTWDGKLGDNMAFIDQLYQALSVVSDTAPQFLGRGDWGGDISGRALIVKLIRTIAKVNRRRRYYAHAIPKLLELAQRIEGIDDPITVGLEWPDGLPADVMERIEEIDARLANRTLSRKDAVKRLDGVDEEAADATLEAVDDDDENDNQKIQSAVPQRQRPQINVNLSPGGEEV